MEKVNLLNIKGEKLKDIKLNQELFESTANNKVLYDAIILTRASLRQGTAKTKNRSEVSGGGRKPWRQKGTGRARQGSIRSVQWVGGGTYGGPVPRDYSKKMNRKERKIALRTAMINVFNDNRLMVVDSLNLDTPKTKEMIRVLNNLNILDKKVLLIVNELKENIILASRNLEKVLLLETNEINVLDLVNADVVVFEEEALKNIEEVLK